MAFVRSVHHDNGDHFAGGHWMLTGKFGSTAASMPQKSPSIGAYTARVRGANRPGLPAFVGLPAAQSIYLFPGYQGAAYLGPAYNPFDVDREQKYLAANGTMRIRSPKWLTTFSGERAERTAAARAAACSTPSAAILLAAARWTRRSLSATGWK